MPADAESLYGIARPRRKPEHEISSSTSNTFSTQLSSLLSRPRPEAAIAAGRLRSCKDVKDRKEDIFTAHRAKKRALEQVPRDENGNLHQTQDVIGGVEESALKRSKRKMEEKARVYAAMRRGDYVPTHKGSMNDDDRGPLVDFDRKWAEAEEAGKASDLDASTDDEYSGSDEELMEYTDEFGRQRKGTRAQVAREERRRRIQANAEEELSELSARPKMPTNLIRGDAVQAAAFNPEAAVEQKMADLAARRDRSITPPEDVHYDATKEVRSKGVGFYQFSKQKETRKKEMEDLGQSRKQTEQWDAERQKNREKKVKDMDENLRRGRDRKSEREANAFLKTLGSDLGDFIGPSKDSRQSDDVPKKKKGWGK